MENKLSRFFHKNSISMSELLYIRRSGRKTAFHLLDGRIVENYMHLKDLLSILPGDEFLHINKSIIVAKRHIMSVQQGIYTMADGRELEGRVRTPGAHNTIMHELELNHFAHQTPARPKDVPGMFSILDNLPIPFCVVEVVIDDEQPGMDLIFRYGNEAMIAHERRSREEIIDRSFFELYPAHVNAKWIAIHSDVALNGGTHVVHDYDEERDMHFTFYCFQPCPGLSAICLIKHELLMQ